MATNIKVHTRQKKREKNFDRKYKIKKFRRNKLEKKMTVDLSWTPNLCWKNAGLKQVITLQLAR